MRYRQLASTAFVVVVIGCATAPLPEPSKTTPAPDPSVHAEATVHAEPAANEAPTQPSNPDLPEIQPATFASWPSVTEKPIQVGPTDWTLCISAPTPQWEREREAAKQTSGPHAHFSIVVRVSPDAAKAFQEGEPLPEGAIVVKEKHRVNDLNNRREFEAYAFMIKREAGYDEANGDWEYAFVTLQPNKTVKRGKLAKCAECHAKASEHDYLFRNYLADGK